MNFLRIGRLIEWVRTADGQDADVTLTVWGREFLQYLLDANYNWALERPL
jgi:hypothetical protein